MLGLEKMDAFRVAIEFRGMVERIVPKRGRADLRDQIERASTSIVLNLGEGYGRRAAGDKAHFYSIARGSATECAAVLAVLRAVDAINAKQHHDAEALLERVVMMLSKLIGRFSADTVASAS